MGASDTNKVTKKGIRIKTALTARYMYDAGFVWKKQVLPDTKTIWFEVGELGKEHNVQVDYSRGIKMTCDCTHCSLANVGMCSFKLAVLIYITMKKGLINYEC